jgi:DNA anti-recombination protein RmuC
MSESEEVRELLERAEMHEKAAAATEDERARKLELAMAAELRRKAQEASQLADTPLHRIRAELKEKLQEGGEEDAQELRGTIEQLNRVIGGGPRS